jgi:hypothetical protein
VDEDVDVLEGNLHVFWVGNKVRREVSGIELYAVDLEFVAGAAWKAGAVADSTSIFQMSQNAVAYCSELSSHIWISIGRLSLVAATIPESVFRLGPSRRLWIRAA